MAEAPDGEADRREAHESVRPRRRWLTPAVLSYAVNPPALAVVWLLRRWELIAQEPLWLYLVALWGSAVLGAVTDLLLRRRPTRAASIRAAVGALGVTACIYVTGWGPVLAICYVFTAQEGIGRCGSRAWRPIAAWTLVFMWLGQAAIWSGVAPSLLSSPVVFGLAILNTFGLTIVIRMIGAVMEKKEGAEASLREREDRFRSLVQNSSDMTFIVDVDGIIRYASEASRELLGFSPEDLIGSDASTLFHADDVAALHSAVQADVSEPAASGRVEFRARHADGSWRDIEAVVSNVCDRPSVAGFVVNARDVTERRRAESALAHQALHDALTGLPNRLLFMDRLEQALVRFDRERTGHPAAVFLDLDRFKLVNDGLGHDAGDKLLNDVASRLRSAVRAVDTVARFGGDEFVLLIEHTSGPHAVEAALQRVTDCFEAPFAVGDEAFQVSASIGVSVASGADTADELVANADAAMYRAKGLGRGRVQLFDATARDEALLRVHTETALRQALERDELRVYYQPVFELATLRPVGVEALVRWQHPARGLLLPASFMDTAEDSGLIVPIGAWVLNEACRQVRDWNLERPADEALSLSVNLSARQLAETSLVETVRRTLVTANIDPRQLELSLEVTETLILRDPESASTRLTELRALGVEVAIDDFGTGYSSLSYLRRFPVSIVKIDRGFVAGLGSHHHDEAIVSAVVQLGQALGLRVVAEGVETDVQLNYLRTIGCDYAQGFLLGTPQPPDELDFAEFRAEPSRL